MNSIQGRLVHTYTWPILGTGNYAYAVPACIAITRDSNRMSNIAMLLRTAIFFEVWHGRR